MTVGSGSGSEKVVSIIYSKAWGENKSPVEANVATDDPSLNGVPTPPPDVVSSDINVTAAGTALSTSEPVVLQCSVASLFPPSETVDHSQAKSDQFKPVDHANVYASFNTDVAKKQPGTV